MPPVQCRGTRRPDHHKREICMWFVPGRIKRWSEVLRPSLHDQLTAISTVLGRDINSKVLYTSQLILDDSVYFCWITCNTLLQTSEFFQWNEQRFLISNLCSAESSVLRRGLSICTFELLRLIFVNELGTRYKPITRTYWHNSRQGNTCLLQSSDKY